MQFLSCTTGGEGEAGGGGGGGGGRGGMMGGGGWRGQVGRGERMGSILITGYFTMYRYQRHYRFVSLPRTESNFYSSVLNDVVSLQSNQPANKYLIGLQWKAVYQSVLSKRFLKVRIRILKGSVLPFVRRSICFSVFSIVEQFTIL